MKLGGKVLKFKINEKELNGKMAMLLNPKMEYVKDLILESS